MSADQGDAVVPTTREGEAGRETNKQRRLARKAEKQAGQGADRQVDARTEEASGEQVEGGEEEEDEAADGDDAEVVSHKEMRKRKRAEKQANKAGQGSNGSISAAAPPVHPSRAAAVAAATSTTSAHTRSRHSIWVGNLSFRTTPERLQEWFEEKGLFGISRVNMPKGARKTEHNKGFAYVDVPSADALQTCIDLSESHLDGRRLLIKSGSDYSGRPAIDARAAALATGSSAHVDTPAVAGQAAPHRSAEEVPHKGKTGLTKTAQKILRAQKHPPGPTLFIGNLSFNSTEDGVRDMVERSAAARDEWTSQKDKLAGPKKERRVQREKRGKTGSSEDDSDGESSNDDTGEENDSNDDGEQTDESGAEAQKEKEDIDQSGKRTQGQKKGEGLRGAGIRKVRMGQFEDTGKCKGFAFIDFFSPAYATASLIDPRNSKLDGRELQLQYAGADAVRRGAPKGQSGGPRPMRDNRRVPKRPYNDAFKREEVPEVVGPAPLPGTFDPDAPLPKKHKETKEERIRRREGQGHEAARRAKPGAALANAQRGKTGIAIDAPKGAKKTFD